ncbi:MAG: hypothetical protein SWY16_23245 [Cyanobacteriota bacterium]|nr:hypothetical protein [Cyanobacteriota bacterium]
MASKDRPEEKIDRYFPDFQNFERDSLEARSKEAIDLTKNISKESLNQNTNSKSKEWNRIADRFFIYIFTVSLIFGFFGTIITKTTIEQTTNLESGERIEIVTSKQGDIFTQIVGYSLASLAATMGLINKLISK